MLPLIVSLIDSISTAKTLNLAIAGGMKMPMTPGKSAICLILTICTIPAQLRTVISEERKLGSTNDGKENLRESQKGHNHVRGEHGECGRDKAGAVVALSTS